MKITTDKTYEYPIDFFKELLGIPATEPITEVILRIDKHVNVRTRKEDEHEGE